MVHELLRVLGIFLNKFKNNFRLISLMKVIVLQSVNLLLMSVKPLRVLANPNNRQA